jgi:uncharacterized protein (DUF488 family)
MAARHPILTIGHSNHPLPRFLDLLRGAEVTAVADVRSVPVSRFVPHFNKDRLAASLAENGILEDRGKRLCEAYRVQSHKVAYAARRAPVSARGGEARRD